MTLTKAGEVAARPLYVPAEWRAAPRRDVALDLLRGLAMVILVVNHTRFETPLRVLTHSVLSAAEVLVAVSGVAVGMVFGRRWRAQGARETAITLLKRARKLYIASVVVVAIVAVSRAVPFLETEALTVRPNQDVVPPLDAYAQEGWLESLVAIITLEAGPWQFNILGFFVAVLALAPLVLLALDRGLWPLVLAVSAGLYVLGREVPVDVLPTQSERPFPLLVWQVLFVGGTVVGWYRSELAPILRRAAVPVLLVAAAAVWVQLSDPAWLSGHRTKWALAPAGIVVMLSVAAAAYVLFRRFEAPAERALGPLLLPLGRNSFYVFIMHVFGCLAIASLPIEGVLAGTIAQVAFLALLVAMVRRRFLFRWVPR